MGSEYKKTAKDLAFERERTRLHSRIQQLQEEIRIQEGIISKKDALIDEKDREIARLNQDLLKLQELLKLQPDVLQQYLTEEHSKADKQDKLLECLQMLRIVSAEHIF